LRKCRRIGQYRIPIAVREYVRRESKAEGRSGRDRLVGNRARDRRSVVQAENGDRKRLCAHCDAVCSRVAERVLHRLTMAEDLRRIVEQ
jgi:hypothetical protein